MFSLNESHQYYLCAYSCDMRKGFDALCGVIRSDMGRDPLSGEVFIFINRTRTTIKLLHWERGGFVVYHKRLEAGRFALPVFDIKSCSYRLRWTDLVLMVEGISLNGIYYRKRYENGSKIV
jgi:transposase